MKKATAINFAILAVIVLVFFVAFQQRPSQRLATPALPDLELLDSKSDAKNYGSFTLGAIEGRVRNNSSHFYQSIKVDINLYDNQSNQIGSTIALGSNLEPGGIWKFTAPVFFQNCTRFKVVRVNGY